MSFDPPEDRRHGCRLLDTLTTRRALATKARDQSSRSEDRLAYTKHLAAAAEMCAAADVNRAAVVSSAVDFRARLPGLSGKTLGRPMRPHYGRGPITAAPRAASPIHNRRTPTFETVGSC